MALSLSRIYLVFSADNHAQYELYTSTSTFQHTDKTDRWANSRYINRNKKIIIKKIEINASFEPDTTAIIVHWLVLDVHLFTLDHCILANTHFHFSRQIQCLATTATTAMPVMTPTCGMIQLWSKAGMMQSQSISATTRFTTTRAAPRPPPAPPALLPRKPIEPQPPATRKASPTTLQIRRPEPCCQSNQFLLPPRSRHLRSHYPGHNRRNRRLHRHLPPLLQQQRLGQRRLRCPIRRCHWVSFFCLFF